MSWLAIIIVAGVGCGGLLILVLGGLIWLSLATRKKTNRVLNEGDHTIGWLVQANMNLYEEGIMDLPAFVLISPDEDTAHDKEYMTGLARRLVKLRDADPDDLDGKDEERVAGWLHDEAYVEGRRDKLPKRLTEGREVWLAHIWVERDHLPDKRLTGDKWVPCAVVWDDPKAPICTRMATPKERRLDDDEDD